MKVLKLEEAGYYSAMRGLSKSWASTPERAIQIAPNLAHKQGGHNKFIEQIMVWFEVDFPRFAWSEGDTYRVGSVKQSESTMHTITKRNLEQSDFEMPIYEMTLKRLNTLIESYRIIEDAKDKKTLFLQIKNELPEGFLQERVWMFSYKTLQNIYQQRINHKLPQWQTFLSSVLDQIDHPEFIVK